MKYLKEITSAVKKINYSEYDDTESSIYPIGFYALQLKSKLVIFNYKLFEDYNYSPKFLCEFDIEDGITDIEETLNQILIDEGKNRNLFPSQYDYDRIEFGKNNESDILIDDIYFADIISSNEIEHRIVQFIKE